MPKALPMPIVAGLALLVSLVVNFGVIDLATAIAPSPEWEPVRMVEAGWGIAAIAWSALMALAAAQLTRAARQLGSGRRATRS
jgi:hypothetical protein